MDERIDFQWGGAAPDPALPNDSFSARWTRTTTYEAGTYRFTVTGDDGIRVRVDGDVVVNGWFYQAPTTYTADVPLTAGEPPSWWSTSNAPAAQRPFLGGPPMTGSPVAARTHGRTADMTTLAVITPSFGPDFELCAALHASVIAHSPESVQHHIIVPPRDVALFRPFAGARAQIHEGTDFLPRPSVPFRG